MSKLFKYTDYEHYHRVQVAGNKCKLSSIWVQEHSIKKLANYLKDNRLSCGFGICHGTRRGNEQKWFRKFLGEAANVIGTEISDTAKGFPHTIQWDFHDAKPEWLRAVDFIYSNSLDHSWDPQRCLRTWMQCLTPTGVCFLEWSTQHTDSDELDPFGATLDEYRDLVSQYSLVNEITGTRRNGVTTVLVVSNR